MVAKVTNGETSCVRCAESLLDYDFDFRLTSPLPWRILLFISRFCSVQISLRERYEKLLRFQIVDITQTGETLKQNGLVEVDTVAEVSSRLVVNPARLKLDGDRLGALIDALERAVHG